MSEKVEVPKKSNSKINIKGKNNNSKEKYNVSSLTPNKSQPKKDNILYTNKFNINHSTFLNNNNYNINNNISININIDMTNKQKSTNTIKNKSHFKNNPIRIKKEDFKSNNNLIFNTLKNYTNKSNSKKSPFHIRIKSANMGIKDYKFNKKNYNKANIYKKNFNVTTTGFHQKNSESNLNINKNVNKTSLDNKNMTIDNMPNNDNNNNNKTNNQIKQENKTISIVTDHLNNEKKLYKNKSNQIKKPFKYNEKKRGNFSPTINRELLNRKQNVILNYSIPNNNNKKITSSNKTLVNDNKNKTLTAKNNNINEVGSSPLVKGKSSNMKRKTFSKSKEYTVNITNLLYNNQNYNNNKKQIMNYKTKSPINFSKQNIKNRGLNNFGKNSKNFNNKKDFNNKASNNVNKNLEKKKNDTKTNLEKQKSGDIKLDNQEKINNNNNNNNDIQKNEEDNQKPIEEQKNKEDIKLKQQNDNRKNQKTNTVKENDKKRKLNQSKSQNEINSNFIKKNLDDKKNEENNEPNIKPLDLASKTIYRMESICKKGFAGPGVKKTNQDNFFIYKNFLDSPDKIYLGVCDGHGMYGQDISGYLVNNLPQNLHNAFLKDNLKSFNSPKDFIQISNIISLTFVQTNINLVNDDNVDSTFSGTTCSSLLFCPEKIISANVGDSRCVLGKYDGKNWKAKNLTRDHKPSEEDEKKRILDKGGRIESYKDEDGEYVGPERVWLKTEDMPGLAMSRSFGDDVAHTVGVISQPEIFEYNFLNEDKFILLASDGIWEFISSDECVNIVKDYYLKDDIDGALNYLYKESSKRWIMEEEVIDDITLIIIFLK